MAKPISAFLVGFTLLTALVAHGATSSASKKRTAPPIFVPAATGASGASGSGADAYSPTKCEWMAVELNSNFRLSNIKTGFTLQIYCHSPNTVFLSYHYLTDADRDAAESYDDDVRAAVAQVVAARKWTWVKLDGEFTKYEANNPPSAPSGAIATPPAAPARPSGEPKPAPEAAGENSDEVIELKPTAPKGTSAAEPAGDSTAEDTVESKPLFAPPESKPDSE